MGDELTSATWPDRPSVWPDVMTEVEVCQFLRLDQHLTVPAAKRSLRYIRRHSGLPDAGRVGRHVLFRKSSVDSWLAARERRVETVGDPDVTGHP